MFLRVLRRSSSCVYVSVVTTTMQLLSFGLELYNASYLFSVRFWFRFFPEEEAICFCILRGFVVDIS